MRPIVFVAAVMLPALAGCGRGASELGGGGGGGHQGEDSGILSDDGGLEDAQTCSEPCTCPASDTPVCSNGQCICSDPSCDGTSPPLCPGPCPGDLPGTPMCEDGTWACPVFPGACVVDSGPPCGPTPGWLCQPACGEPYSPLCLSGEWQCPELDDCEDAGGCNVPPTFQCAGCGDSFPPFCANGIWECPPLPPCIEDAGVDACSTEAPPPCPVAPCQTFFPICEDGQWECISNGGFCEEDASPPPPPPFSCGNQICDPSTTFCAILVGGAAQEDGGSGTTSYCVPIPSGSCDAGLSCGCLDVLQAPGQCDCLQSGSDVVVTCILP